MPSPEELEREREKDYGPPLQCHDRIAMAWMGYLCQVKDGLQLERHVSVCSWDVANMMALAKIIRAGYNPKHRDNYDDAITYLTFARRFACGEDKRQQVDRSTACTEPDQASNAPGDTQSVLGSTSKEAPGILRSGMAAWHRDHPGKL